jgi:hypothetical protein
MPQLPAAEKVFLGTALSNNLAKDVIAVHHLPGTDGSKPFQSVLWIRIYIQKDLKLVVGSGIIVSDPDQARDENSFRINTRILSRRNKNYTVVKVNLANPRYRYLSIKFFLFKKHVETQGPDKKLYIDGYGTE